MIWCPFSMFRFLDLTMRVAALVSVSRSCACRCVGEVFLRFLDRICAMRGCGNGSGEEFVKVWEGSSVVGVCVCGGEVERVQFLGVLCCGLSC